MVVDTTWSGSAAMKRAEEEFPDEFGPWTDFEWGMLNGKLSAIRWVLGESGTCWTRDGMNPVAAGQDTTRLH